MPEREREPRVESEGDWLLYTSVYKLFSRRHNALVMYTLDINLFVSLFLSYTVVVFAFTFSRNARGDNVYNRDAGVLESKRERESKF